MFRKLTFAADVADAIFPRTGTAKASVQKGSAHDFSFKAVDGTPLPLAQFRGKALLIVNTASRCGFNCQYVGLQHIWQCYEDEGLVVIGVPSNDFGAQEPKSESEIQTFYRGTYGVTFPLTAKTKVRGDDAHEFYRWAVRALGENGRPRWNFHKYLVNADGELVAWFSSTVTPRSHRLCQAIQDALPKKIV